jgi:hypothetical protein
MIYFKSDIRDNNFSKFREDLSERKFAEIGSDIGENDSTSYYIFILINF